MRYRLFLILAVFCQVSIFGCFRSFTSIDKREKIAWHPSKKLKWIDFNGIPEDSSSFSAVSSVQIAIKYRYSRDDEVVKNAKAFCVFYKNKSWVKEAYKLSELLKHEQGHFDIGQIFAIIVNRKLDEMKSEGKVIFASDIKSISEKYFSELNLFQKMYDSVTNHANDIENQDLWNKIIKDRLDSLLHN